MTYTRVIRFPEALRVAEGEIPRLGLPLAPGGTATDPEAGGGSDEVETGSGISLNGERGQGYTKGGGRGETGGGPLALSLTHHRPRVPWPQVPPVALNRCEDARAHCTL